MPLFCEKCQREQESERSNPGTGIRLKRLPLLLNVLMLYGSGPGLFVTNFACFSRTRFRADRDCSGVAVEDQKRIDDMELIIGG